MLDVVAPVLHRLVYGGVPPRMEPIVMEPFVAPKQLAFVIEEVFVIAGGTDIVLEVAGFPVVHETFDVSTHAIASLFAGG